MKIHILSDLHNEFSEFVPAAVNADIIVLAGDIDLGDSGIQWARRSWPERQIIYVAGNHEYYHKQIDKAREALQQTATRLDVHLLDPGEAVIGGVRFLGCTLWTDFCLFGEDKQKDCMLHAAQGLSDFRVISKETHAFTPQDSLELHKEEVSWLSAKFDEPFDGKTMVVTHHIPTRKSVAARYQDVLLSACFASTADPLLGKSALWVHGHTHDSFDYMAGGTRIICNPRGYCRSGRTQENAKFNPGLVVEI